MTTVTAPQSTTTDTKETRPMTTTTQETHPMTTTANPLRTSAAYRAMARRCLAYTRESRVRDAVTEAFHAANPARVDRADLVKYEPTINQITRALLDGDRIAPAVRDAIDHWHPNANGRRTTETVWRILIDLQGGPDWWR